VFATRLGGSLLSLSGFASADNNLSSSVGALFFKDFRTEFVICCDDTFKFERIQKNRVV